MSNNTIEPSKRGKLNPTEKSKVVKGAALSLGGLVLMSVHEQLSTWLGGPSLGGWSPVAMGGYSILLNLGRKLWSKG